MDSQLQKMWEGINQRYFDDELKPLAAVDWDEISGENGIGAHGLFFPKSRCIVIDENFRFDEEAIRAGDEKEKYKAECAYLLLIHEMVHQVLYQRKAPQPGGHGASFLAEAERISKQMGQELPTAENVKRWPVPAGFSSFSPRPRH
jgi:hypothetical protein